MLRNYFKVSLRNILKQKFYSFINILGLTVGLTCSTLIIMYINDELGYDRFHHDYEQVYRMGISGKLAGQTFDAVRACAPMAATIAEEFPEVESSIRLYMWEGTAIQYEDRAFAEKSFLLADSNFFDFFDFNLLEGDPTTALKGPNKLVLSESAAIKYFDWQGPGDNSPVGKIVYVGNGGKTVEVSGIVENSPENSHIPYDVILSLISYGDSKNQTWSSNNYFTYFRLKPGASIEETQIKLDGLVDKYVSPEIEQFLQKSISQLREQGDYYSYFVQPLADIHLNSNYMGEFKPNGNITYLYIFGAVALIIILLASINFMNLSTARSAGRAKEVGIRKTVGASRSMLSNQFLVESVLYAIISVIPTIILVYLFLTPFNNVSGKNLSYDIFLQPWLYIGLFLLALIVGVFAGTYPAFYLTSFNPVDVLKGKVRTGMKGKGIRSILVVFQFSISIILIICTLIVYQQLQLMQNRNLGFDKENILVIDNARKLGNQAISFRDDLIKYDEVVNASISENVPPHIDNNTVFRPEGSEDDHLMFLYGADNNHLSTYGYELIEGRYFDEKYGNDSLSLILNETAMKAAEWKEIEGKRLKTYFDTEEGEMRNIIGVVRNFNFMSMKENIRPLVFSKSENGNFLSIRLSKGNVAEKVKFIESKWKEITDNAPFEYSFVDQEFDELFHTEKQLGTLAVIFTGLAIFVACLGLFGLATFMSEQRAKEIGIRKVMGSSSQKIVFLLTKEFTKLVLISFIIAVPCSYMAMDWWLTSFVFKIDIGIMAFIIGGAGALAVSWITVGFQSFRAANQNPVTSLRSE